MQQDVTFYIRRATGLLILLGLSAVFLFSAGTKLIAIEPFEWSFLELLPVGFTGAALLARLFIAIELGLAFLLVAHLHLRKFTFKAAIAFLVFLTGYLVLLLAKQGNTGNCGCFGDAYQMTPVAAIIKNGAMIAAILALYFLYPREGIPNRLLRSKRKMLVSTVLILIVSASLPFIISPVYLSGKGEVVATPISLDAIYDYGIPRPAINLKKGKHIVAFLSLTCPHCRKAAYLLQLLLRRNADFPLYMVLNGKQAREQAFFGETKSLAVPHSTIREVPPFGAMAGEYVPAIFWINNSVIERKTYYTELDPVEISHWLKGK